MPEKVNHYGGSNRMKWIYGLLLPMVIASTTIQAEPDLYVGSSINDRVLRYDSLSGFYNGEFISDFEIDAPRGLTLGPDGDLYVSSGDNNAILRYDGASGEPKGIFAQGGGLNPPNYLVFVASPRSNTVGRYDGVTGEYGGEFALGGGLDNPRGIVFGPFGDL